MKYRRFILGAMTINLCLGLVGWGSFAFSETSWGVRTYAEISTDITQLTIAGEEMETYGYIYIFQHMLVDGQTLIVLGRKEDHASVLSAISLSNHTEIIIARYSSLVGKYLQRATLLALSLGDEVPSPSFFILLQYLEDQSGRYTEESRTFLELFRASEGKYTLLRKEQLTETQLMYEGLDDLAPKYMALQLTDGPGDDYPATKDLMRYFFSDVNEDGYADILILKQQYQALAVDDPRTAHGGMFFLAKETLHVMYFEAEEYTFSSMMPVNEIGVKSMDQVIHQ